MLSIVLPCFALFCPASVGLSACNQCLLYALSSLASTALFCHLLFYSTLTFTLITCPAQCACQPCNCLLIFLVVRLVKARCRRWQLIKCRKCQKSLIIQMAMWLIGASDSTNDQRKLNFTAVADEVSVVVCKENVVHIWGLPTVVVHFMSPYLCLVCVCSE